MVDPNNVKSIFLAAIEKSPAERASFLEQALAGDASLRLRVEALLKAHEEPGTFLEARAAVFGATIEHSAGPALAERAGTLIGPYKLLQQIGEGGMGVVFMAEQTRPVQRTVALKITKPGMDTRQVIARFEAERQAVAMMDHPNIAKVLDAGTTDTGRPYFVMDLVKGVAITKYCDEKHLPLRARLELFMQVCQAVQHAHQKGIIHRDIKPNNVLVAEYDNQAVPKVIDFGVAKATAQKLTERTMFTEFGQVLGTMEYMSPEQSKFNQLDIDTRSDIYSLGVLLYELLTGSTPFEGKRLHEAAFDEMLRIIREEEPQKPSTRVSSSDTLPSIAANRHTEPARLSKDVRGELDWIVMKALEKDRNRRYETASGFAADIDRHLNDEPVEAGPPSAAYRFRKFGQRNKAAFVTAGAATAVLVAAVVLLAVSNARIRQALAAKDDALATAREAVDQMLTRVADEKLVNVPLADPLRKSLLEDALRFYEGFLRQAETDPSIRLETASVLRRVSAIQRELGRSEDARRSQERSVELLESLVTAHPGEPTYCEQLADAHTYLANTISAVPTSTGSEEAETHLREALRLYSDLEHDFPERPQATGNSLKMLADVMTNRGDLVEAERLYRQAIAQLESYVKVAPNANTWLDLNRARFTLVSRFLDDLGTGFRPLESERLYQEALDATEQGLKIDPQATRLRHARAQTRTELGQLYQVTDQPDKAISLLRQSMQESQELCEQSPWVHAYWIEMRDAQQSLIAQLQSSGHSEELKLLDRRVYEWLLEIVPRIPVAAVPQMELSTSLVRHINRLTSTGQEREGNELARIASDLGSRVANNLHDTSGDRIAMATIRLFSCSLAMLASDQNEAIETEETRRLFRQAATLHNELTSSADYADRLSVSEFYLELGRRLAYTPNSVQELSDVHREHLLLLQGLLQDFPDSRNCRTNVGHQLRWWSGVFSQNDAYAAHKEEALRVAIDVFDKLTVDFPKDLNAWHWLTETRRGFGSVLERNGKSEEAEVQYRRIAGDWNAAIEGLGKSLELRNGSAGIDGFFLAIAHQQLGHHDEARKWYDQAVAWMEKNQPHDEQLRRFRTEAEELLKITEEKPTTKPQVDVK